MRTFWYLFAFVFLGLASGRSQTIVFSEIHYNPADGAVSGNDYEFLELKNTGPAAVDLRGAAMVAGITYTFTQSVIVPAGGSLVLAKNRTRFAERYPTVTNLAPGVFGGQLSNSGETLTLVNGQGAQLYSVTYKDTDGWPLRADGLGSSLVLENPTGNPDDPANWKDSALLHGQPGQESLTAWTDVVLNEILAHTDPPEEDAIELKNLSSGPIDLTGWFLTDNPSFPTKYKITSASPLPGGGYRVFYEYQFNANPPVDPQNQPFLISSTGESVLLLAPHPNGLRIVDGVKVPATPNGVTFGRHPDGVGSFTLLEFLTFGSTGYTTPEQFRMGQGAANSGPLVESVVINEVMYHPATEPEENFEYIEFFNRGPVAIDLSGWVMRGVGDYAFPAGTTISAGGYLVLASNPAAVIAKYGLNPTTVVGPYTGQLSNNGELLRLTDADGVIIDFVEYQHAEPWPAAADGQGPSLERLAPGVRGDGLSNWHSSRATTDWVQLTWTQTVSGSSQDLRIWADYNGLIWLDDVSVKKTGAPAELVLNGDFEDDEASWTAAGNHAASRPESGQGRNGTRGYGIGANFTRILADNTAYVYQGDSATNNVRTGAIATEDGQEYEVSLWLRRGSLGGKVNVLFAGQTRSVDFGNAGTPGAANSITLPEPGPGIQNVAHASNTVAIGGTNAVVADISGNPDLVELRYRFVGDGTYKFTAMDYQSVPMTPTGGTSYSGTIPGMTTNGAVLYHIRARKNALAYEVVSPRFDDPNRDWGYRVESNPMQTTLPNWRIYVDGGPIVYPFSLYAVAVSPDGQVFPHSIVRHRGRVSSSSPTTTGIALRMNKGRDYDSFFAPDQEAINFRHRRNISTAQHSRTVNEYLFYRLQRLLGLVTAHTRHVCLWIDGDPTITMELESPQNGFLDVHGLDSADYISRAGYTGRNRIDGDDLLDNFDLTQWQLENASGPDKLALVKSNLWLETTLLSIALNNIASNGDQHSMWNTFQHRRADNGLWSFYPWDTDIAFNPTQLMANGSPLLQMHPYYQTPNHPSMWSISDALPLGSVLFYPETGPDSVYTLSYRHRQQMNLWRLSQTLFTEGFLDPILDQLVTEVGPAFDQIASLPGQGSDARRRFVSQVNNVKTFIEERRAWLYGADWSDKDPAIWNADKSYNPTAVVISEIMVDPAAGPRYIELYNPTTESIDASWWRLDIGTSQFRLPHGTLIAPESRLVVTESQSSLTALYTEFSDPTRMVQRNNSLPLWDDTFDPLAKSEYRTRAVEIPGLQLPLLGTTITLRDWQERVVCQVPYLQGAGWPAVPGSSLELVAGQNPALPTSWRSSFNVGTPGSANTADDDLDADSLPDSWEQQLVDHFAHIQNIADVDPNRAEFGDGLSNRDKYVMGLDPTLPGKKAQLLSIEATGPTMEITYPTVAPGSGYINRFYTLEWKPSLTGPQAWTPVESHRERPGDGLTHTYTNSILGQGPGFFRLLIDAEPARQSGW